MKQNLLVKSLLVLVIFGISFFSLANAAGPVTVGNGWNSITNYFVADWTGDGIPDSACQKHQWRYASFPLQERHILQCWWTNQSR